MLRGRAVPEAHEARLKRSRESRKGGYAVSSSDQPVSDFMVEA